MNFRKHILLLILSIWIPVFSLYAQDNVGDRMDMGNEIYQDEENDNDTPVISLVEGGIEISIPDDKRSVFQIFSITGQLIKKVEVIGPSNRVELPKGCYIIKCDRFSKKMIVR